MNTELQKMIDALEITRTEELLAKHFTEGLRDVIEVGDGWPLVRLGKIYDQKLFRIVFTNNKDTPDILGVAVRNEEDEQVYYRAFPLRTSEANDAELLTTLNYARQKVMRESRKDSEF